MKFLYVVFLNVVLVVLNFQGGIAAQTSLPENSGSCFSTAWPSELSDLEPDPSLVRGMLNNGFRYIIKNNSEPQSRVALYLNVQAGSLHETDEQRGVAHFLEHMLFNGSANFPPGKLVEYFQSIGMNFGGDTNAHTTYDETVYKVILAENSIEQLQDGLLVMADYARRALLLDSEIDRERGVILAEKRTRDSASYRAHVAARRFAFRGTRMVERQPIGVIEVIESADHQLLKQFYDAWYRPENMVLVIVGDIDPARVEPEIISFLSPLEAGGPMPECPEFGSLKATGLEAFYHYEEELGSTNVSIETLWNDRPQNDSYELQIQELREYAGAMILSQRIEKLLETPDVPFTDSGYYSGELHDRVRYGAITAKTDPAKWQETLKLLEATLRQSLQYGFSEAELNLVKRDVLAGIDSATLTAGTRDSKTLAMEIIRQLNDNRVFQSPQQEKQLYSQAVSSLVLSEVNDAFRAVWNRDSRLISLSGNIQLDQDIALATILDQYREASKQRVKPPEAIILTEFPYLKVQHTEVSSSQQTRLAGIDAEQVEFANGVVVNMKRTDFQENRIQLQVNFGDGKIGEPRPGLSLLAESVVNSSGTGTLQKSELADILAGSTVHVRFSVGGSSFVLTGSSLSTDLELLFQVVYAVLQDPGIRKDAFQRSIQELEQMYGRLQRDINGASSLRVERFFAGGDSRIGLPAWEEVASLQFEDVRNWLMPQFAESGIEVSVVGDFQQEEVVSLAEHYFGTLKKRQSIRSEAEPITFPVGQDMTTTVNTKVDKALVTVAWPTTDFWNINRTRRLHILADIFEERLRKVVREKLGATYSPVVYSSGSRVYPGYGVLVVQLVIEPGREQEIRSEILKIGAQLQDQGVTVEELERVKGPMLTTLKDTVRNNSYWLRSVLSLSSRYPQQLVWPATLLDDYASITAEEIATLATMYLHSGKAATAVVLPEPAEKIELQLELQQ